MNKKRSLCYVAVLCCFAAAGFWIANRTRLQEVPKTIYRAVNVTPYISSNATSGATLADGELLKQVMSITIRSHVVTTPQEMAQIFGEDQKNIFFIVISKWGILYKTACAIESASRTHPDWTVYVMTLVDKHVMDIVFQDPDFGQSIPPLLHHSLFTLHNVQHIFSTCYAITGDTPLPDLCTHRKPEKYWTRYIADGMRLLLLYTYGGMYADVDVIFVQDNGLAQYKNIACWESKDRVNNAVLQFERHNKFVEFLIEWFYAQIGSVWAFSGPVHITNMNERCTANKTIEACNHVTIMEQKVCYPAGPRDSRIWLSNTTDPKTQEFLHRLYNDSEIITAHLNNGMSTWWKGEIDLKLRGRTKLLGEVMYRSCRMTYNMTQDTSESAGTAETSW